ncbi:MAG: cache domain-containing protein [Candidatus Omnitrophota bacterium]
MTIRSRLTIGFIVVILVANSFLSLVTALHVGNVLIKEVQKRVRLDLNSARRVYNDHVEKIERVLRTAYVRHLWDEPPLDQVKSHLDAAFQTLGQETPLAVMTFVDPQGRVLYRAHNPEASGDDLSSNPLIAKAIRLGEPVRGTLVVSHDDLVREGVDLSRRAMIPIHDTPAARPSGKTLESDGMMIAAALPIRRRDSNGELLGVLYGANLLNQWFEIVDVIKDEVFQDETYEGKNIGMATIFLGDLRISTNVPASDGSRAVGTRLSAEVYDRVLMKGEIWDKRAFVVNDWYITAYEPIRDPGEHIIGALYVGLLEKPFKRSYILIVAVFLITVTLTTVLSLFLLDWVTKRILKPIGRITVMAKQVIEGNLTARVGIRPPGEMGRLCREIDLMADAVYQREELLKQTTRRQIGQSEKLASVGRLAAGIAHEINNPLTGVLTFAHLLHQKVNMSEEDKQDLEVIIRETTRVREIVRGLLDFARESPSTREPLDVSAVIQQTFKLVRSQKEFRKINIVENLDETLPLATGDKNQLQQVFLNLALNACEAMPEGGELKVSTFLREDGRIAAVFADSGHGIPPDCLEKIFDPFFTTKPVGKGTGLGLSVSYGIIQNHGGTIDVRSEPGEGAVFTILLPVNSGDANSKPEGDAAS